MSGIKNAAPMARLLGIQDLSGANNIADISFTPIHMAFVPLYTQRGPAAPQAVVGSARNSIYGADSFNMRKKYANHGTVLSNVLSSAANTQIIYRLKPKDAPDPASIRMSLEVVATQIPLYERTATGDYKRDVNGMPIPTGEKVDGHVLRWTKGQAVGGLGTGTVGAGDLVVDGVASVKYPIYEDRISSWGEFGNNVGRRIYAVTAKSEPSVDSDVALEEGTAIYRIQFMERTAATSSPTVTQTLSADQYVDFSFKPGAINSKTEADLFVDNTVLKAYRNVDISTGNTPVFGPVDKINVYHQNVSTVLKQLYEAECTHKGIEPKDGDEYLMNFMDGLDLDGNPYETFVVQTALDAGSLSMSSTAVHYAEGGGDGTMSDALYAELVRDLMTGFETNEFDLMDMAKYPITTVWDTGFDLATKKTLLVPMGLRKDITCVLSTQDVNEPLNSRTDESSITIALRTAALQFPESEYYGTKTCRAIIVGHGGTLIDDSVTRQAPMTIDLAKKVATYMGSSDAVLVSGAAFDQYPNNVVTSLRDVNIPYKPVNVRNTDWSNGLTWVQQFDATRLFYPAIQTVYEDDTSVLNGFITTMIAAYCEKIVVQTWKQLTGRGDLTNDQFIERSNLLIADAVKNRFDDRVVIEPDTYFTDDDTTRGFSWSCKVNIYANVMKTVGTYTLVTRRREELSASTGL